MHPRVQRVIDRINSNLHRKLKLTDLARLAGLSRSRFCQGFKTEIGVSVGQYVKALRMQKACELLATTSLRVKEIGAAVGMRDQSHFSRDFKRTYDLTPSQYRERFSIADREK
jgi:two-component system, response regulator YesN